MALFQSSVIQKELQNLNQTVIDEKWNEFIAHFGNVEIQQKIRELKEEQYQGEFLDDLFVKVLGYTKPPKPNHNLVTEQKNETNSKKADGAIIVDEKVIGVIELKGTNTTDLEKVNDQAFLYKVNHPECIYVITSNFEKLRFYIENKVDYIEFNLFQLTKKEFSLLYICLSYENIKNNVPKHLKDESVSKESKITKQLYKDYSDFKQALFNNLVELNPQYDKLLLFKKTQKLLDRFLFIFFAEDRQLVPTNLIRRINLEWEDIVKVKRLNVSLYDRYKTYFDDLNAGATVTLPAFGKKTGDAITAQFEIFAYNGGLFMPDEVLDNVKIDDALLHKHSILLSDYDFESDVDVNILGHIFENSLNEIDEIKSEIEGQIIDKTKTKRKKDGVFYTPKYITKYIVDNTVGKICTEKKNELKLNEEEYHTEKNIQTKTKKALLDKLTEYRNWLLNITICDPACGSGAFLNQALEFLITEHRYIDELQAKLMGDSMILSDVEASILENNLFGVDLNDESVEIAKLSLWLRTAQRGRKLTSLNNNIKCGNSLIDDPEIAGEKAFSWEKEFPNVFDKGGFDVIIGNPPYVSNKDMHRHGMLNQIECWNKTYYSAKSGNYDIYIPFIEKSLSLLRKNRLLSFIIPNKFLSAKYSKHLLELISKNYHFVEVIDYSNVNVFSDASVYPIIITLSNSNETFARTVNRIIVTEGSFEQFGTQRKWDFINLKYIDSVNKAEDRIITKIETSKNILNNELSFEPGINGFQFTNYSACVTEGRINDNSKRLTVTGSIDPHIFNNKITRYKKEDYVEPYISYNPEIISEGKWGLFCKPKVMVAGMTKEIEAALDINGNYAPAVSVYSICGSLNSLYSVQVIINSKLINWFFKYKFSDKHMAGGYISVNNLLLQQIPFRDNLDTDFAKEYALKANKLRMDFENIQTSVSAFITSRFNLNLISKKLQRWDVLDFSEFLKELKKEKVQLSLTDEAQWLQYLNDQKKKVQELKKQISQTDREIDRMVYELYGLTEEEIQIVENS
ncbi:MAG: Eco57I restriction-modification methylase domain-containing protein [Crocinitomicaceae bacterium]|nr:Eco57I restriction-modification methylase domain-containing protein [Crocinitomicaceae bacterium]